MKNKFCIIASCCALFLSVYNSANAQKHEVSFSWGSPSFSETMMDLPHLYPDYYHNFPDIYYIERLTKVTTAGTFSFGYAYNFRKWFALTVNAGFNIRQARYINMGDQTDIANRDAHSEGQRIYPSFHLGGAARFSLVSRKYVKCYASIGLGVMYDNLNRDYEGEYTNVYIYPQFIPFGIRFGNKVFGLAEIGLGEEFFGGRIGIGYKF